MTDKHKIKIGFAARDRLTNQVMFLGLLLNKMSKCSKTNDALGSLTGWRVKDYDVLRQMIFGWRPNIDNSRVGLMARPNIIKHLDNGTYWLNENCSELKEFMKSARFAQMQDRHRREVQKVLDNLIPAVFVKETQKRTIPFPNQPGSALSDFTTEQIEAELERRKRPLGMHKEQDMAYCVMIHKVPLYEIMPNDRFPLVFRLANGNGGIRWFVDADGFDEHGNQIMFPDADSALAAATKLLS